MIKFTELDDVILPWREGVSLCSPRAPLREAKNWVGALNLNLQKTIFVLGAGGGFHIDELCRMHPGAHVVTLDFDLELEPDILLAKNFTPQQVWTEVIHPYIDRGFQVVRFRPAWARLEKEFERLEDLILGRGTKAFENVEWLASDAGVLEWLSEVQPGFFQSIKSVVPRLQTSRLLTEKQKILLALRELVD